MRASNATEEEIGLLDPSEGIEMADIGKKSFVTDQSIHVSEKDLFQETIDAPLPEGTLDPVYEAKAKVLNAAVWCF